MIDAQVVAHHPVDELLQVEQDLDALGAERGHQLVERTLMRRMDAERRGLQQQAEFFVRQIGVLDEFEHQHREAASIDVRVGDAVLFVQLLFGVDVLLEQEDDGDFVRRDHVEAAGQTMRPQAERVQLLFVGVHGVKEERGLFVVGDSLGARKKV